MNTVWTIASDGSLQATDAQTDRTFRILATEAGFVIETQTANGTTLSEPARCKPHAMLTVMDMVREGSDELLKAA